MATRLQAALLNARRRARAARDWRAYDALAATPGDLETGVELPANGRLELTVDAETETGEVEVDVSGRTIGIAGGPAGTRFSLGWHEEGRTVTTSGSLGATATLHVIDEWHSPRAVATGSV